MQMGKVDHKTRDGAGSKNCTIYNPKLYKPKLYNLKLYTPKLYDPATYTQYTTNFVRIGMGDWRTVSQRCPRKYTYI